MFKEREHCYLAAPFFNDEQKDLCTFIEALETEAQPIYSPRSDGYVLKPDATVDQRSEIFYSNIKAIDASRFILVVIDDFDPGVMFEFGAGFRAGVPILTFSDVEGRGLNVMLAGASPLGFVNGRADLKTLFKRLRAPVFIEDVAPKNTWSGEIQ